MRSPFSVLYTAVFLKRDNLTMSNSCPTHIDLWPKGFKAYPDLKCPYLFAQDTVRKENRIELIEWSYLWSMSEDEDDDEEEPGWLSFLAVISSATMLIMQSLPNKVWNLISTATEHFTGNMRHTNIGQTNLVPPHSHFYGTTMIMVYGGTIE